MKYYERESVHQLHPYTPGEQPVVARLVKLNTNENPYPLAGPVLEAIRGISGEALRRYPPPTAEKFRQVAAQVHGVAPEQIIATNGGDELLRMVVGVFCDPAGVAATGVAGLGNSGGVAVAEPSYSLYPVLAEIHQTPMVRIPLREDWSLPEDFGKQVIAQGCRLVMIVNPHAPSGRLESVARLAALARELAGKAVLLVDEAYVDFASGDALALVKRGAEPGKSIDNVILLRTLSKGYSLAGLRFGYGIGHPDLITALQKVRDSYNTDIVSQTAAAAALESRELARESWKKVIAERGRVGAELQRRGFYVSPSESNFILVTPPAGGLPAKEIYEALAKGGIFVRYFNQDRLRDKLRITIGTPEQNGELLAALERIGAGTAAVESRR